MWRDVVKVTVYETGNRDYEVSIDGENLARSVAAFVTQMREEADGNGVVRRLLRKILDR